MTTRRAMLWGLVATLLIGQALTLLLLLGTTQLTHRKIAITAKLRGAAPHVSWLEVASVLLPAAIRPGFLAEVQCPETYFGTPIWQKRTESDRMTLWSTPMGDFWASPQDGSLLGCIVAEEKTFRIYDRPPVTVRTGDVVIDGGAHVGTFSRLAFQKGASTVVAFEPDPRNVEYLKRNFEKEIGQGRFVIIEKALWDRSGPLKLSPEPSSAATSVSAEIGPHKATIPGTTIDEAVRELGLKRVDFIKLDIEGGERRAILGSSQTLARFSPRMVVCTYHAPDDAAKVTELVLRAQPAYWLFATATQAYFYLGTGLHRPLP